MAEINKIKHDGDATKVKVPLAPAGVVPRKRDVAAYSPPTTGVRRYRAVLSLVTLLCPPLCYDLPASCSSREIETFFVDGLVNVAPIASRPMALMRGLGRRNAPCLNSPDLVASSVAPSDATTESTASPPQDVAINTTTGSVQAPSRKIDRQFKRKGVWLPPSQNPGKIFSIQQPQDLLDFVIEDERLSVGESIHQPMLHYSMIFFHASHIRSRNAS
jgi:hypothetical protein